MDKTYRPLYNANMGHIPFVMLSNKNTSPLHRQIYDAICRSILSGEFDRGEQLPATRVLASQLGVSRMTVVNAFEQLLAEGYVEGKPGSGTYVATTLPEKMLRVGEHRLLRRKESLKPRNRILSRRGKWLASTSLAALRVQADSNHLAFQNGLPALDEFPFKVWSQLGSRRLRNPSRELLSYGDPAGYRPLREAIATHLKSTRGVQCDPDQVVIVGGTQQALDLIARLLLNRDDQAWIENPCYPGARNVLASMGANVIPVPLDAEGFDLPIMLNRRKSARLVYVTPSHQFPLGVTMSLSRRLALLEWAKESDAWIIEDDYNSEFRYTGRPLPSLQGLDVGGRVIYIGTFSKTIFPSLRMGCMVVPRDLAEMFIAGRALIDRHSPSIDQAILTDFIEEGHFARHVRRMRALYAERQELLVDTVRIQLAGLLEVKSADAGMHLIGWLPEGMSDKIASERAAAYGVEAAPLSAYSDLPLPRAGLALGYTAVNNRQIKEGVRRLAQALSSVTHRRLLPRSKRDAKS